MTLKIKDKKYFDETVFETIKKTRKFEFFVDKESGSGSGWLKKTESESATLEQTSCKRYVLFRVKLIDTQKQQIDLIFEGLSCI